MTNHLLLQKLKYLRLLSPLCGQDLSSPPTSAHPPRKIFPLPLPFPVKSSGSTLFMEESGAEVINGYQRFRAAQNYVLECGSARTTPEMAAAAFDVPLLALKGINANLNFPNSALSFHIPKSTSAGDIRAAVVNTAKAQQAKYKNLESPDPIQPKKEKTTQLGSLAAGEDPFIEEEELLSMPNLPVDKAEGMLVSLSRLKSQTFDEGIFILFFTFHLFA